MPSSTVLANSLVIGCSLLLMRRGPTRRLRQFTLAVGVMSLAQAIANLHLEGIWLAYDPVEVVGIQQKVTAAFLLLLIYLLGREIYDRKYTDSRLRLVEHEVLVAGALEDQAANPDTRNPLDTKRFHGSAPVREEQSGDLIALTEAVGLSRGLPTNLESLAESRNVEQGS